VSPRYNGNLRESSRMRRVSLIQSGKSTVFCELTHSRYVSGPQFTWWQHLPDLFEPIRRTPLTNGV
jgi:hypothetical protein